MKKNISTEELHKEIDLIQSCINRMSKNSFSYSTTIYRKCKHALDNI